MKLYQWLIIGVLVFIISVTFTLGFLNLSKVTTVYENPKIQKQSYLLI